MTIEQNGLPPQPPPAGIIEKRIFKYLHYYCLIIYPNKEKLTDNYKFECVLKEDSKNKVYSKVYKIGIPMPYII